MVVVATAKVKTRSKYEMREHFTILGYHADPVVQPMPLPGRKTRPHTRRVAAAQRRFLYIQGGGIKGPMYQELVELQKQGRVQIDQRGHTWYAKIYTDTPTRTASRYRYMAAHMPRVKGWH